MLKARQSWGQPQDGKGIRGQNMQPLGAVLGRDGIGGAYAMEGIAKRVQNPLSDIGCHKAPADPAHQGGFALRLKAAQAVADGRRCNE